MTPREDPEADVAASLMARDRQREAERVARILKQRLCWRCEQPFTDAHPEGIEHDLTRNRGTREHVKCPASSDAQRGAP